jgi:hypothetical protein
MSNFLEKDNDNLANYLVLPLLSLSKASFGEENFINAYIGEKRDLIAVEVKETSEELITAIENHPCYTTDLDIEERSFILFKLPLEFKPDIDKFAEGKYSEYTEKAKVLLRKYSGLKYKVRVRDPKDPSREGYVTHAFLRALDKDQDLRREMEHFLGVKIDSKQELLELPRKQNYSELI